MKRKQPNQLLKRERDLRGWSQRRLAEAMNTTEQVVNRWENGRHRPNRYFQEQLCELFGKSAEELGFMQQPACLLQEEEPLSNESGGQETHLAATPGEQQEVEEECLPLEAKVTNQHVPLYTVLVRSSAFLASHFPTEKASGEHVTWFSLKQHVITLLVTQWYGRAMYCDELQTIIDQELCMFDLVKTLYKPDTYTVSRRDVLQSIAALPFAAASVSLHSQKQFSHPEEILPVCAASLSSCWHLLNSDGLATIEQTLPRYLPALLSWAQQPSRYQRMAAYLASQGCLLMDLLLYHRHRFQDALSYTKQAVELAELSEDRNLQVYALLLLGPIYSLNEQKQKMLEAHQRAETYQHDVFPALRSYTFAQLALSYARSGKTQEALRCIGEAKACFPTTFGDVPGFLAADYGFFQLALFEGRTYLTLGEYSEGHVQTYSSQASAALAQVGQRSPEQPVPQRSQIEIVNYQAQAAIGMGNMEEFLSAFHLGIKGARELGSEKRLQEAVANWQKARQVWPQEARIEELAELLH